MRRLPLAVLSLVVLCGLAACTGSQGVEQKFRSAAEELGYECHETVPPTGSPQGMVSCANGADGATFVIFADEQARKAGEGLFISGENSVEYGDRWLIVGSSTADLAELRERVQE
jgi:hypothetical protein